MPRGGARNDASLFGPQCFDGANYWNQKTKDDIMEFNRDIYLTIVVNPAETSLISGVTLQGASFSDNLCIKQNIFVGDSKIIDGWYNKGAWDSMVSGNLDSLNKFCLGTCSMGDPDWWFLTHMDCYSLRFYNRALTDDEVKANRKKTIEYHKILESQSKEE